MANYNLTNQTISSSFQQLLQKDTDTGTLVDGLGNVVDELIVTSSYALTASFAENVDDPTWDSIQNKPTVVSGSSQISFNGITDKPTLISGSSQVDYTQLSNIPSGIVSGSSQVIDILVPLNQYTSSNDTRWSGLDAQSGSWVDSSITGSSLVTASFATQTLTFTKGDGTTFDVNIPDVSGSDITALNQFTQSQEELNTTFATTGSNTFVDNQTITQANLVIDTVGELPTSAGINFTGSLHDITLNASGSAFDDYGLEVDGNFKANKFFGDGSGLTGITPGGIDTGSFATTGSNTFDGDQTINGTNVGPANPLSVEDGNGAPILQVNNATLKGFTNVDVLVNGNQTVDGILKVISEEGYGGGVIATNEVAPGNFSMNLAGGAGYSQALFSAFDTNVMEFNTDTNILFDNTGTNGGKGAGNITFSATASINLNVNEDNKIFANGNMEVSGSNSGPGNTLQVEDGNGIPILAVQNATLKGLTDVDVVINGNQFVNGNISATGSLGIADNNFIISSGSNTVEFNGKFSDGQAGVVFTAPNSKFNASGNYNLQVGGISATDAPQIDLNSNAINSNGNHTVSGTNTAPSQTFIVKDGNSTNRLEVNNATLSGFTSVDVNINGKTQITDTLTLQGDGIVNGTNTAPSSTFVVKDGNSTNRLEVNNATLSGFTGVDVNINGKTQITDTLTTIVDVKVGTQLVLLDYLNLDFANDTAAAAGGVPLGGIYHHNNQVLIRTT